MDELSVKFPYEHLFSKYDEMLTLLSNIATKPSMLTIIRKRVYDRDTNILIRTYPKDYWMVDSFSNYFTEYNRLCVSVSTKDYDKKKGAQLSPMQKWERCGEKETVLARLERYLLSPNDADLKFLKDYRDSYYHLTANLFNPCIMIALLHKYNLTRAKVLDPTAGWGDRLIASLLVGVKEYVGFDTNDALIPKYEEIALTLNKSTITKFICCPFEYGDPGENFDVVFTSPPFFDVEVYEGDKTSTALYKTREEWDTNFYLPFLQKSSRALKPNGYIMLYIPYDMFKIADDYLQSVSFKFVEQFGFYQQAKVGVLNFKKIRYTYIWIKDY